MTCHESVFGSKWGHCRLGFDRVDSVGPPANDFVDVPQVCVLDNDAGEDLRAKSKRFERTS